MEGLCSRLLATSPVWSIEGSDRFIIERLLATLFPNEASLRRLASAVLSEISDDGEAERAYPHMEAR